MTQTLFLYFFGLKKVRRKKGALHKLMNEGERSRKLLMRLASTVQKLVCVETYECN